MYKSISYSHFARLTGASEGAVRKAILRGSISKGVNLSLKKIDAHIASNEWGKPILPEFGGSIKKTVSVKKPTLVKPIPEKKQPVPRKQKKDPETIEEFVAEIMHEKLPAAGADDLDDETVSEELDDKIQKPEAERITSVLKAKILQITYKEKQGQLIDKSKINPILFGFGQEIRIILEGLSNRIVDDIRGAESRPVAKRLIDEEVYRMLNKISDILSRKI